jgi:hypothetical protein
MVDDAEQTAYYRAAMTEIDDERLAAQLEATATVRSNGKDLAFGVARLGRGPRHDAALTYEAAYRRARQATATRLDSQASRNTVRRRSRRHGAREPYDRPRGCDAGLI